MKIYLCLLAIASCSLAVPVTPGRRYFPEEDGPIGRRYLLVEKDGEVVLEDLMAQPLQARAVESDVTYYLFTKQNPDAGLKLKNGDIALLANSNFSPVKKNVFIAHGWNNNYQSSVNQLIRTALLQQYDVNVFVVDWSGPANKNYITASNAVTDVGKFVGSFINSIIDTFATSASQFTLIGHSLGAHVCGNAGAAVKGSISHIVGMDPASPLFSLSNTGARLDTTDADEVEIIHTNGGFLGFSSSIGHVDYFPNGGSSQPGCGLDLIGTCAHGRSYQYYAESIINNRFVAQKCNSYSAYLGGSCTSSQSLMGGYVIDEKLNGDYYLQTNSAEPFGRG